MKKFLVILTLLILVMVGGVIGLVITSFNPAAYQKQVVASIQKLTGREVTIEGDTSITWSPIPTIIMQNIRLANIDKSQNPVMLSIDQARITIAWESLLKSPLVIKNIELTHPVLLLERTEANRANFNFPFLLDPKFQLQEVDLLSEGGNTETKINSIVLKDGIVQYDNKISGLTFETKNINGTLAVDTVRGPFRFNGKCTVLNKQYALSVQTGAFQGATPIETTIKISEPTMKAEADITGTFTPTSSDRWFDGAGHFSVGRFDSFLETLQLPAITSPGGQSAVGSLSVEITPTTDVLKDLTIQLGEGEQKIALTGTFSQTMSGQTPSYQISVGMDTFNDSDWKAYLDQLNWQWIGDSENHPNISFVAKIQNVPYKDAVIRDVALSGQYNQGTLTIGSSSAILPGNTTVLFTGAGQIINDAPLLELTVQAQTEAVSDLLQWAFPTLITEDKKTFLTKASTNGRLAITPNQISFNLDELKLNDTLAKGTILRTQDTKPKYAVNLAVNNINCDTFSGWKPAAETTGLSDLPALIKSSLEKSSWLSGLDIEANLNITDGTLFGTPASTIQLTAKSADNTLRITSLNLQNWAAANLSATGTLSGIGRPHIAVDGLQLSLTTKQLSLLLNKLKLKSDLPLINKATAANIQLGIKSAPENAWMVDARGVLSDTNFKLVGTLDTPETNPTFRDLSFDIAHPSFKTFTGLLSPNFNLLPKLDGSFKTKGVFSGSANRFSVQDTSINIGMQQITGNVSFDNQAVKTLTATLASPSLDLERFMPNSEDTSIFNAQSGKLFDFSALDDWNLDFQLHAAQLLLGSLNIRQADIALQMQNKELTLERFEGISGASDQAPIHISGKLDWNTTPRMNAIISLQNIALRPDFLLLSNFAFGGGVLSLNADISTRGTTLAEFIRQLNGKGNLTIRGGQMIGVNVDQMIPIITRVIQRKEEPTVFEPEFRRVLNSGKTALQELGGDFAIANGIVRMMDATTTMVNATANPTQIIWDLPKNTLDVSIPVVLKPLNTLPPFILGISLGSYKGEYRPNYEDLSSALSNQSQTALADDIRHKQEEAQQIAIQKRHDRVTESKNLTEEARKAVSTMEQKLKEFPFEKGQRLYQSAKDALTLVNQLAVREEPTEAQLIHQIEQARLVLVKFDEFQTELSQETAFNTRQKMDEYHNRSTRMVTQLKLWAEANPDIDILVRLADNATQNGTLVDQLSEALKPDMPADQVSRIMAATEDAVAKIEKAYQHAARFDLAGTPIPQIEGQIAPAADVQGSEVAPVRGSFSRSK